MAALSDWVIVGNEDLDKIGSSGGWRYAYGPKHIPALHLDLISAIFGFASAAHLLASLEERDRRTLVPLMAKGSSSRSNSDHPLNPRGNFTRNSKGYRLAEVRLAPI